MILCSSYFSILFFRFLYTCDSIFSFSGKFAGFLFLFFNFAREIGAWLAKFDPFAHALRFNVVLSTRCYSPAQPFCDMSRNTPSKRYVTSITKAGMLVITCFRWHNGTSLQHLMRITELSLCHLTKYRKWLSSKKVTYTRHVPSLMKWARFKTELADRSLPPLLQHSAQSALDSVWDIHRLPCWIYKALMNLLQFVYLTIRHLGFQ